LSARTDEAIQAWIAGSSPAMTAEGVKQVLIDGRPPPPEK